MNLIIWIGIVVFNVGATCVLSIGNNSQQIFPAGFANISTTFPKNHKIPLTLDPNEKLSLTSFNRLITATYWRDYPFIPVYILDKYYDILGFDGIFLGLSFNPDGLTRNCHKQAHNAGKVIFIRSEDKIRDLRKCSKYCQGVRIFTCTNLT